MRLMVVVALVINVFLALTLVFYQATRKTYPGFRLWTTGVSFLGLGYLSWCLRGSMPDSISILVVNGAFPLGMVLQLDGLRRFLGLTPMPRLWYALPGGAVAAAAVFYFGYDSIGWRTLIVSIALSVPHFAMALLILRQPVRSRSMFYGVIGTLLALGGLIILFRAVWSLLEPHYLIFWNSSVEFIFFVSVVALQLGETLAFIMLNTERVESELVEAEADLRTTVDKLQEALAGQKLVEESLRESEDRYHSFFDTSRDSVFMTGLDGQFMDFNDVALEVFGYGPDSRDELLRTNVANVYANPEERQAHAALVAKQGFCKEHPMDLRKKDGTIFHALITTVVRRDAHGTIIGFQGTVRDITEQKRVQEELRTTLNRFYTILSSLYAGVLIVTEEGRVEFVNQAFCDLFDLYDPPETLKGLTAPEMIARIKDVYAQPAESVARIREVVSENRPLRGEAIAIRGGRTYMVDYVPILVEGEGSGRLWHHNDITELKKAEEARESFRNQLLHAQKMEAIGTLTGGIAHDFNNLLTIINGFAEMLLMDTAEDDPRYSDLKKIHETGLKGADMVQRLLSFTKQAATKLEPMDLSHRIEETKKLMESTFPKMIEIETILADDLGMVNADAGQMDQLLMNLCVNAKDAIPDGGRLRLETRNINVDEEYCRLHVGAKPGRHVLIEVSDTGTGMSKETMERIFDPFFTTKGWDFKKGTGLGLSVAKGIVEQHGGWIICESELGKGTTFKIYLPAIEAQSEYTKPEPLAETVSGGEKILLVDDEEYVRDLGKRILERSGYTVITAGNGKDALDIYAREQSSIALVVLDLIMPQMGGEKCLEELLKINRHVRVIVSTGHSLDARERLHVGSLARGFVNKPYEVRQLVQAVKAVLEAGGPTG